MYKIIAVAMLVLGVAIAVAAISRQGAPSRNAASPRIEALSPVYVKKLILDATLKDGKLSGRFFNQNDDVMVTQVTVEAALKGKSTGSQVPRIFNVMTVAQPQAMSKEFQLEASALNPDLYTLRLTGAMGSSPPNKAK